MRETKSIPFWKPIKYTKSFEIIKVNFDLENLVVTIESYDNGSIIIINFNQPRGFRVLDEGDLLEFWPECSYPKGIIFEIIEGGWFELESERLGFVSKYGTYNPYKEYLVTGDNFCVNVITNFQPEILKE